MKQIFFIIIIIFIKLTLYANISPIDSIEAKTIATNYFEYVVQNKGVKVLNIYENYYNNTLTYYAISFNAGGHVIVSADNATVPILSFSLTNTYKPNSENPTYINWMNNYSKQIIYAKQAKLSNKKTLPKWDSIKAGKFNKKNKEVLEPLIQAQYGQDGVNDCSPACEGYNKYVPKTNENCGCQENCTGSLIFNYNCLTGCMGTAMAQVIDYWEFVDINGYNIYDWANMADILHRNSSLKEIFAIAHLSADVGYFADMGYCTWYNNLVEGDCMSFAFPTEARKGFRTMGYSKADVKRRGNVTNVFRWKKLIKDELDLNRPVVYSALDLLNGNDDLQSGHTFIIDGYDNDDMFHVNWGWSGNNDDWFTINELAPGDDHYNRFERIITDVYPDPDSEVSCSQEIDLGNFYENGGLDEDDFPWKAIPIGATLLSANNTQPEEQRTIYSGEEVKYIAYNQIVLRQGFHVEQGAKFHAYLTSCPEQKTNKNTNKKTISSNYVNQTELNISPNPFTNSISIAYKLLEDSHCSIQIYDLFGGLQKTIVNQTQEAGLHNASLSLSELPNGIYLCVLKSNSGVVTQKIIKVD